MTWTAPSDPENIRRDAVRVMVGDTSAGQPLISDEGLAYHLANNPIEDDPANYAVASAVCLSIAGKFAREVANTLGPLKQEAQVKWEHYTQQAAMYEGLANGTGLTGNAAPNFRELFINTARYRTPRFTRTWPP